MAAMLDALGDIAPGKQRGREADEGDQEQHQSAQPVAGQPFARRRDLSDAGGLRCDRERENENDRGRNERYRRGKTPAGRQQHKAAGEQWNDEDADELHDAPQRSRSDASWPTDVVPSRA